MYGAIHANFAGFGKVLEKVRADFDEQMPFEIKREIHTLALEEQNYGGRWFQRGAIPESHWSAWSSCSDLFPTAEAVFGPARSLRDVSLSCAVASECWSTDRRVCVE